MSPLDPKSIKKNRTFPPSMDYRKLKKEGIEHVQELSGKVWTDYNEHDPGITILENLCYALTELGYKTNFSIPDLFFSKNGNTKTFTETFYHPSDILPTAPTTIRDYRKLLIDNIKEVKNAWFVPKRQSELGAKITGLFEVLLLLDEERFDRTTIINKVLRLLNENRNIGEDFESIKILEPENISIEASISITQNSVGEAIIAEIINALLDHFAPNVSLYNLEEAFEFGYHYEDVFNNPPVENGFILDEELESSSLSRLNKLFKSDLIKIISGIEGVNQVINFKIFKNGKEVKTELIQLDKYKIPFLDIPKIINSNSINLFAGEISYIPDQDVIQYTLDTIRNKETYQHKRFIEYEQTEVDSSRDKKDIQYYYSMQNSFPRNYGITEYGLDGQPSKRRLAQVKQLQAYLFIFEQIMSSYLAQLVNVDKLLSADESIENTYFTQASDSINGFKDIIGKDPVSFQKEFQDILDKYDKKYLRRNRFLDHLLARFGEEFLSEAYNAIHRESSSYAKIGFLQSSIKSKVKYLKNYVEIARDRAKGYNKSISHEEKENVSGLKKRICLLFNINDYSYKKLSEISNNKELKVSKSKSANAKVSDKEFIFSSNNPDILSEILAFGVDRSNYQIEKIDKEYVIYFENPITRDSYEVFKAKTISICEDKLTALLDKLTLYNKQSEGFHIIEHILLRDVDSRFCFTYLSDNNILFRSEYKFLDPETEQLGFVADLIQYGKVKKNYKIENIGEKRFKLSLLDDASNTIIYNDGFIIKKSAEESISFMVEELKKTTIDDPQLEFRIQYEQDVGKIKAYDEDPFSLQLSFVLPGWTGRFNSSRMKYLFENIVKMNAPAHLKINFLWLSIKDLSEFEKYYEKWLIERSKSEPVQPLLDDLSHLLLLLIKKHTSKEADTKLLKEIQEKAKAIK